MFSALLKFVKKLSCVFQTVHVMVFREMCDGAIGTEISSCYKSSFTSPTVVETRASLFERVSILKKDAVHKITIDRDYSKAELILIEALQKLHCSRSKLAADEENDNIRNRSHDDDDELLKLELQVYSNLSLCHIKQANYRKALRVLEASVSCHC
jgi:hypothetical protein